jgi:hypothetical protein
MRRAHFTGHVSVSMSRPRVAYYPFDSFRICVSAWFGWVAPNSDVMPKVLAVPARIGKKRGSRTQVSGIHSGAKLKSCSKKEEPDDEVHWSVS